MLFSKQLESAFILYKLWLTSYFVVSVDCDFVVLIYDAYVVSVDGDTAESYKGTQLGQAVLSSALSPSEGLAVFAELRKARQCLVLENDLHIVYLVSNIK